MRNRTRIAPLGIIGGLLLLFIVTAAACDDGPQPTVTEAVHPALEKAVATLRNTSSFGFVERWSESIGGISLEFGETGFEATGNYQSPDRFTKRALVSEFPVQPAIPARSINVGEERYLIDPATGEWMLFHDDLGLGQIYRESLFRNPVDLFSAILAEGEPHEYQGIITLDGVSVHHFVSATRRQAYTRAAGPLHIEIWVGVEDLLVRKMTRSHSWTEVPCEPDRPCPDIGVIPGSEFNSLQFSFSGDESPIVAPPVSARDTVQSPFGPMALFRNVHVPFSIRYPAAWKRDLQQFVWKLAVFRDQDEPAHRRLSITTEFIDEVGFKAEHGQCFEDSVDEISVTWCNLVKHMDSLLGEGTLRAKDYTDYWLAGSRDLGGWLFSRSDIEVGSRQRFGSGNGSSSETMDIRGVDNTWTDTAAGRRLTYVQRVQKGHPECDVESLHCFAVINVSYVDLTGALKSLQELADHSFSTIRAQE